MWKETLNKFPVWIIALSLFFVFILMALAIWKDKPIKIGPIQIEAGSQTNTKQSTRANTENTIQTILINNSNLLDKNLKTTKAIGKAITGIKQKINNNKKIISEIGDNLGEDNLENDSVMEKLSDIKKRLKKK